MLADVPFFITAIICDAGWIMQLAAGALYFVRYGFSEAVFADILSLAALAAVAFGVIATIYMNLIHEKEIATRLQKDLSFGATIFGGLAGGITGLVQLMFSSGGKAALIIMIIGGFVNFVFGAPIFASFRKGIFYSSEAEAEKGKSVGLD